MPHNKIPEHVFREYFLPIFSGQRTIADNDSTLEMWFRISGGPDRSVDVINHLGETVVTVPPIYNTSAYKPVSNNDMDIGSLVKMASEAERNLTDPRPYTAAVENTLSQGFSDTDDHQERWKAVFDYFGIVPIKRDQSSSDKAGSDTDDSDFFEYE